MRIVDCVQLSPIWWEARRGLPTASGAKRIITPAKGELSKSADEYICELIGDRVSLTPNMMTEQPMTAAMRNGSQCEPDARRWYEMQNDLDVVQVGLCVTDDGKWAASPDGLVGDDGLLELKCPQPKTHVKYLLGQELPEEYKPQVHMQLIVTGRKWCEFVSYAAGFDPFVYRVEPDEFTDTMRKVLGQFQAKYDRCWEEFQKFHHVAPARQQFEVPDWLQDPPKGGDDVLQELQAGV
jgi:hypothetical protein